MSSRRQTSGKNAIKKNEAAASRAAKANQVRRDRRGRKLLTTNS